jgi:hypothetical protein
MSLREKIGKLFSILVVAVVSIVAGAIVLAGTHAGNDYLNGALGWGLIGIGVIAAGVGAFLFIWMTLESRAIKAGQRVHLTPRDGEPAPPPAWNMSEVGKPGSGVVNVDRMTGVRMSGRGSVRTVGLSANQWDVPLVIGALILWTVVALIVLSGRITNIPLH